jgi:putative salt-induced outer membrane protein YdiY
MYAFAPEKPLSLVGQNFCLGTREKQIYSRRFCMDWRKVLSVATTFLTIMMLFLGVQNVAADQVILKNGDQITGTVVKADKGVVTLKTVYAEKLEIKADAVQSINTNQSVDIRLMGGDILSGPLKSEAGETRVLGGPERGSTSISWPQVASINVPPPSASTWTGNVFLGAFKQSGNTDRTSATFGGEAVRKSARDRFGLSLLYNYAEEDGSLTTRDTYGTVKYDYFFTKKFYGYLGVEILKDRFKDLNLRTIVGPGVGYQFLDDETNSLALEAGLSYFSEDRIDDEDDQWLTARLGARFRYKLCEHVTFTDNLTIYPNLESGGDFTSRNEATLTTTIAGPWALRLANIWEHDSAPSVDVKKNDTKSSVNLQYSF